MPTINKDIYMQKGSVVSHRFSLLVVLTWSSSCKELLAAFADLRSEAYPLSSRLGASNNRVASRAEHGGFKTKSTTNIDLAILCGRAINIAMFIHRLCSVYLRCDVLNGLRPRVETTLAVIT